MQSRICCIRTNSEESRRRV